MYDNGGSAQLAYTAGTGALLLGTYSISIGVIAGALVGVGALLLRVTNRRSKSQR